jgi:hypothetical protein
VHEHVIKELDRTIEEGGFEFLAALASAPAMGQVSSVQRIPVHREIGRHALELHRAALLPGARPRIDDPVRQGDHVQIVFDDDDRGAGVDQPVEQPDQGVHIVHVQARRAHRYCPFCPVRRRA